MMGKKREFRLKGFVLRAVLASATAAVILALAGCGKLNAIERNQFDMQAMLQENSDQMAEHLSTIGEQQLRLQETIETSSQRGFKSMFAIEEKQQVLRSEIEKSLAQMINNISAVENNQRDLQLAVSHNARQISGNATAIEKGFLDLQSMVSQMQDGAERVITKTAAIEQNQFKLQEGIETGNRALVDKVTGLEECLRRLQETFANIENGTQKTMSKMATIEENQLKLQESIESNIRQVLRNTRTIERLNKSVPSASAPETIAANASEPVKATAVVTDAEQ